MRLKKVEITYESALPIFEVYSVAIYQDNHGNMYKLDSVYGKEKENVEEELRNFLLMGETAPEKIEGEKEFESTRFLGIRDRKGILYRFRKI